MTAQIINMRIWRIAHSEPRDIRTELVRIWLWPVRIWLACWGIR